MDYDKDLVTEQNIFTSAKDLLNVVLSKVDASVVLDRCLAICSLDGDKGTNKQYLDELVFCTVSDTSSDIAFILTKLNAQISLASDLRKAVPKVQFLRVFGDVLAMCLLDSGVDLTSLSYLSECSSEIANALKIRGISRTRDDALMSDVVSNFSFMLSAVKIDYVKPYRSLVDNYIDKILLEYTRLFESGFGFQKPKGIMTHEGFYFVKNESLCLDRAFDNLGNCENFDYVDICAMLNELGFKASDSPYFDPTDALVKSNYIPKLLLYFALGCVPSNDNVYKKHTEYSCNWDKYKTNVIKPYLRNIVFNNFIEAMVKAGKSADDIRDSMNGILDVLTRCCLVMEWDMKLSLKCRVTSVTMNFTDSIIPERLFESIYQSVGEIIARRQDGFLEFKLIKDVRAYNSEPLFAFEALDALIENGQKPSWENVILGRLANDLTFTYDMSKYLGYHIVAASRMGKGVMSLSLLGSALGSKYPIAYLDSKPDMAKTIYDICPEAAICTAEQCAPLGISEVSFSDMIPEYARQAMGTDSYDAFGGIVYAKMLQLLLLVAEVRFKVSEGGWTCFSKDDLGWDYERNSWTKLISFVDELEKATVHLNDELAILKTKSEPFVATKKQMQDSATEDGSITELIESAPMYAKFSNKVVRWERKLCSDLMTGSKSVFGKGQLQMVFIYQSFDQSDASAKNHNHEGIFRTLKEIPRTAKIIGGDANYYPDAAVKIGELGNVLTQQKRWFSLSTCEQSVLAKQTRVIEQLERGTVVPFKPYLLLNSSGINDACVSEFLNGADGRRDKYVRDGQIIEPRIGFEPYIDYMLSKTGTSATAVDLLKTGAVIMLNLLSKLGYASINSFLFDFSINSFRSINELLDLLRTGGTIDNTPISSDGVTMTPDSFQYKEPSLPNGDATSPLSRREKMLADLNKQVYFPSKAEVIETINFMISSNSPAYDRLFSSSIQIDSFATKICEFVKGQGGIEL